MTTRDILDVLDISEKYIRFENTLISFCYQN